MDITTRYFQITVMIKDKSVHKGIRLTEHSDIDSSFLLFKKRAEENYGAGNIIYFECVQLSRYSDEVKNYIILNSAKHPSRKK